MSSGVHTFDSPRALAVLEQIEAVLHERGGASTWDLAAVTGLSQNRVGEFLREMGKKGTAVCVERAKKYQGGTTPARWGPGLPSAVLDEATDDAPRVVIVRKEWEPNHARMKLDCYLFGMPAVLEAA